MFSGREHVFRVKFKYSRGPKMGHVITAPANDRREAVAKAKRRIKGYHKQSMSKYDTLVLVEVTQVDDKILEQRKINRRRKANVQKKR